MSAPDLTLLILAGAALAAVGMVTWALSRGWRGWLDLKRAELARGEDQPAPPNAGQRIELADLKERIKKLEAIAAGVDL